MVPEVITDPRDRDRADLLLKIARVVPITAILNFLLLGIIMPESALRYLSIAALFTVVPLLVLVLVRRGSVRRAAILLASATWILATYMCLTSGGILTPAFMMYPVVILGSGILISLRAGIVTTAVSLIASAMMTWMDLSGTLPEPSVRFTPLSIFITLTILLGIILIIQYLITSTLNRALSNARDELESRKNAEQLATRHRSVLSAVLDSTRDLIVAVDSQMHIIAINAPLVNNVQARTGFRPLVGMSFNEIIPPDRRETIREIHQRLLNDEQVTVESQSPREGGVIAVFEELYSPIHGADGSIAGFTIFIRDITERKQSQAELQRSKEDLERRNESLHAINEISQELHRSLEVPTIARVAMDALAKFSRSPRVAFFVVEEDGEHLLRVDARGFPEEMLRASDPRMVIRESLSGVALRTRTIVTSDDIVNDPRTNPSVAKALSVDGRLSSITIPLVYQEQALGAVNLVFSSPLRIDPDYMETLAAIGKTIGMALANAEHLAQLEQEVRERRRTEAALQASEERYRRLVENASLLVAEITLDGRYVYANVAHQGILGYDPGSIVNKPVMPFVHGDDQAAVLRSLGNETQNILFRFRHADGTYRWLEGSSRSFVAANSDQRFVLVASDVTVRVNAEEAQRTLESQLLQSQKLEAVGTLAGGIAHDFNNILVSLLGNAELAKLKLPADHPVQKYIERLLDGSERARDLVRQILAFSRRQEGVRKPVQLQSVVKEGLKLIRASIPATIEIRSEFLDQCPYVLSDPGQIHQVLLNLCTNAVHAMDAHGGRLQIREGQMLVDDLTAQRNPDLKHGLYYVLSVEDSGKGISSTVLPRIFEPFFTTKDQGKGTGLGLSVVHGIVRSHNGAILVRSEEGKGTVFEVFLPVFEGSVEKQAHQHVAAPPGKNERLLVIDDEPELLATTKDILLDLGYQISEFSDAREALELFRRDPHAFDLIITDLTMPRMTGVDLAHAVRMINPYIPILLVTGYQQLADDEQLKTVGIREIVTKPFRVEAIAHALRRLLDTQQ